MNIGQNTAKKIINKIKFIQVYKSTRHLCGPKFFDLSDDEVVCIILGQNIEYYIDKLFLHHLKLGIKKFIYFDNNSNDESVEKASKYMNTMVIQCNLSFREYQAQLRRYSVTSRVRGGWRLVVDADELFEYPNSDIVPINVLVKRLNLRGFNGLVAQMLDLVPDKIDERFLQNSYENSIKYSKNYNINSIKKIRYYSKDIPFSYFNQFNLVDDDLIYYHFDGIRNRLFGENCCLTKHPLFRVDTGVTPLPHPHVSMGLRCADFTGLLRHYKFSGDFIHREQDREYYGRLSHDEGRKRLSIYNSSSNISFLYHDNRIYSSSSELLEQGFLVASEEARRMLNL